MKKYVYGTKFSSFRDHWPLLSFRKADQNARVQKWRTELTEYDFEIFYRPGKINIIADALFRNPITSLSVNVTTRAQKRKEVQKKKHFNVDQKNSNQFNVNFINTITEFLGSETAKVFTERKIIIKNQAGNELIEPYNIKKKKYFIMRIDTHCSQSLILESKQKSFIIHKNLIIKNDLTTFCI